MRDLPAPSMPLADHSAAFAARRSQPQPAESVVSAATDRSGFEVAWARDEHEVREAQQLRYRVFVEEMGASLALPKGSPPGHDIDVFDPFCEHLLVRVHGTVIGTYRVLTPANAKRVGGLYSDGEFDLTRLRALRGKMMELGRSCVHPDWRSGGVILALWGALAEFMHRNDLDTVVGCASVSMRDGGHCAASLWQQLKRTHFAPIEWQVTPRLALPVDDLRGDLDVETPALIKGYLRCGGKVLGPPAWDPHFNTADLPMLLRIEDLPARYRKHFF